MNLEQQIDQWIEEYNRNRNCEVEGYLCLINFWVYRDSPSSINIYYDSAFKHIDNLIKENLTVALLSPSEYVRRAAEYFVKESK
jgi:hypothetical protein